MAVSFTVLSYFSLWRNYSQKPRRSWGVSPPPPGHPHCDHDVFPAIGLRVIAMRPSPTLGLVVQEGALFYQKKGFLLSSYFL
jgi:hypothetical protein